MERGLFAFGALAILAILLPAGFSPGTPDAFSEAEISFIVSGSASVSSGGFRMLNFTTNLFPKEDERQRVLCSKSPSPSGFMEFSWKSGETPLVEYSCAVSTKTYGPKISGTEKYPLEDLPASFSEFLSEGEVVRLTPEIRALSRSLVLGETTEFGALLKIADFVNKNITYDGSVFGSRLDTGKVLAGKRGVCEEFAHLFIALSRSAGIPARYVGGFAWGGRESEEFGSHGWAEAYFPGKGWVPFDPTTGFAQYGWLDTSHIKLYTAPEAAKSVEQVSYDFLKSPPSISWRGINPTNPKFSLASGSEEGFNPGTLSKIAASKGRVSPGEAFLVNSTLSNSLPTAIGLSPSPIYLARNLADGENLLLVFSSGPVSVPPKGVSSAYFVFRAPEKIAPGYYYEYPIGSAVLGNPSGPKTQVIAESGKGTAAPEIFPDYGIFYGLPGRQEFLFQPETGIERSFKFPISSGKSEVSLRGFEKGLVFSSTGSVFFATGETPEVSVIAPKEGYVGEDLELSIYSEEDVSAEYRGKEYLIPKMTEGKIPIGAGETFSVKITLLNGTVRDVSGTVRRMPKPTVSLSIPLEIKKGGETLSDFAIVSNGRMTHQSISNFPGNFVSGEPCSDVKIDYEVEYEDMLGRKGKTSGTVSSKVSCGRSAFSEMLSNFFRWLFGK